MSALETRPSDQQGPVVRIVPLEPEHDAAAAAILAPCAPNRSLDGAQQILAAARADPHSEIYGLFAGDELAAVCVVTTIPFARDIAYLVVREGYRGRGYGRAILAEAVRRSGRRPLTVESTEETAGFYQACGFRVIGKRRSPDGSVRYRLGWHAPRPQPASGTRETPA